MRSLGNRVSAGLVDFAEHRHFEVQFSLTVTKGSSMYSLYFAVMARLLPRGHAVQVDLPGQRQVDLAVLGYDIAFS